ncbi:MAG: heme NO-binding domain-containing protein [Candidatus Eisenbacteria bacterium]|nr:heme NO-binding domain-containing protein [Candidatus Eisenbacteria bacterium]
MKGIVFNLLEEVVRREHGEDTWDGLLEAAGLAGAYTSVGSYHEEELLRLVAAASSALGIPPDEVVRWFGRKAMPLLAGKYPAFFGPHRTTRSFLLTLNGVIHTEVRKLYSGADVPVFDFDTTSAEVLGVTYVSRRKLCALAEGLILGAADHFREEVAFEHTRCLKRGDPCCAWRLAFRRAESSVARAA